MFDDLVRWVVDCGGIINYNLGLINNNNNRSVIVVNDVKRGEIILKFPKALTIGKSNVNVPSYDSVRGTIIKLLFEIIKGDKSIFYKYLVSLPCERDLESLPSNRLTYNEFMKIKDKDFTLWKLLEQHYKDIIQLRKDIGDIDIPDRYKSLKFVSYLFNLYKTRAWNNFGFVPLVDLLQHSKNPNVYIDVKTDDKYFVMVAVKDIKKGDELMHCYNNFTPIQMFMFYGIPI